MNTGACVGVGSGIKQCSMCIKVLQPLKTASLSSQTVPEELQNGRGFGYVVAFRPYGKMIWMLTVLASADASRYVFRNESVHPFSPFEVKVGVFNNKGEGPFSPTTVVYSAEEGMMFLQFWEVDFRTYNRFSTLPVNWRHILNQEKRTMKTMVHYPPPIS